jgi:hypothetical protein
MANQRQISQRSYVGRPEKAVTVAPQGRGFILRHFLHSPDSGHGVTMSARNSRRVLIICFSALLVGTWIAINLTALAPSGHR